MRYFGKNELVEIKVEHLTKAVDEEGNRIYSDELLQEIYNRNFKNVDKMLEDYQRKDRDFMEPLLYAVKHTYGTYIIYNSYSVGLQNDEKIAMEIIKDEPELIKGTPMSRNSEFILKAAQTNPRVVTYMDKDLSKDIIFKEALKETLNIGINIQVMKEVIIQDASLLQYIPEDLKNNYEFIRETSKENYQVVEHIIDNRDEFGLEAIRGAKDTTRELTVEKSMTIVNNMAETSTDKRYGMVANKVKERGEDNIYTVRWTTAMAAQSDKVTPEYFKKVLDDSILAMIGIQKDLTADGKEKVSIDRIQTMVTPTILNRLKDKAVLHGLEVDADLESKLEEYTEFFNDYRARLQEEKRKNLENKKEGYKVGQEDVERKTIKDGCTPHSINGSTENIRKAYEEIPMLTNDEKGMGYNESEETR